MKKRIWMVTAAVALFSCAIFAVVSSREHEISGENQSVSWDTYDYGDNSEDESVSKVTDEIVFSFKKVKVKYDDFDYYSYLLEHGYAAVENNGELKEVCTQVLAPENGKKTVKYILTEQGKYDFITDNIEKIKDDTYLYNMLGLDYQYYYSRGTAVFLMKKIQDIDNNYGSFSVYAIYKYSYNTAEEIKLLETTISNITADFSGDDYDRMKQAYDYLKNNVRYVEGNLNNLHTAYGAIINHQTVCEGFAKAYKLMLDELGIENYIVVNTDHAWNVVVYNGQRYLVDTTNGNVNNCDAYFLLGEDVLKSQEQLVVDGYIFNEELIKSYGYMDGCNTDEGKLAATSINHNITVR